MSRVLSKVQFMLTVGNNTVMRAVTGFTATAKPLFKMANRNRTEINDV
jgi:hypothetical protein